MVESPAEERIVEVTNSSLLKLVFALKYLSNIVGYWLIIFSIALYLNAWSLALFRVTILSTTFWKLSEDTTCLIWS
jgi:hypothetical protein